PENNARAVWREARRADITLIRREPRLTGAVGVHEIEVAVRWRGGDRNRSPVGDEGVRILREESERRVAVQQCKQRWRASAPGQPRAWRYSPPRGAQRSAHEQDTTGRQEKMCWAE